MGSIYELSMHLFQSDTDVVLIDADRIRPSQDLTVLTESPYSLSHSLFGAAQKSKVICAVLWNQHFDLGAVRDGTGVRLVFQVGHDWNAAHSSS
jgi:hypothetical protein